MAFSEKTTEFLFENRVMDSRTWFEAHRADYEALVLEPLRDLVRELTPTMLDIDPLLVCEPKVGKCISRIFRDTRYSRDKRIFRDVMWLSFFRTRKLWHGMPGFFFELSPRGLVWGCGYYQAAPETMEAARQLILAGDRRFQAVQRLCKKRPDFTLEDLRYKRSRHPDAPPELHSWLNLKNLCLLVQSEELEPLWSADLAERLAADFRAMKPFYEFLMAAESRVRRDGTGRHEA